MLDGVDILNDDPNAYEADVLKLWVSELQKQSAADRDGLHEVALSFGVTFQQAKILLLLAEGKLVSVSRVGTTDNSLKVQISKLKRVLPAGVEIDCVRKFGYTCGPASRAKLKAIMNGQPAKLSTVGA